MAAAPRLHFLEHTADVGLEISADTLPDVFRAAAAGMFELLVGAKALRKLERGTAVGEIRALALQSEDVGQLLVDWLRELLYWHDSAGLCAHRAEFDTLTETQLESTVHCARYPSAPLREIKGVTYHQLQVERRGECWYARVIFDV